MGRARAKFMKIDPEMSEGVRLTQVGVREQGADSR
jgi:hypothetical protein